MIELHYGPTPNGHKMTMFFEETGLPYKRVIVNLRQGEQSSSEYLKINPNGKIPAIVDHDPADSGAPITMFESGAILQYLADKAGQLMPQDLRGRLEVQQWLFWQVAGLSPMAGQNVFFRRSSGQIPFAIERYTKETARLFGVLNERLADRPFLGGENYSIADISAYPWTAPYNILGQDIDQFPHLERWLDGIHARPATRRAYQIAAELVPEAPQPPGPRKRDGT